ncbi:MAG: 1-acyl-sn-glycerol-3-phosphate acyltransferase [Clostridia bacterium]|nr:1-acyl-sn-glycerol-3-phosphate acyltransferase [Clostridia bacterium]
MKIVLWIVSIILGLALLYFLIPGFFALFVNPKKNYTKDSKLYRTILNAASVIALKIMRVKIQVSGAEKLTHGQKLLFVGNHRSNFDPIITWYALRDWKISYISKSGNFKIPIFGRIIRRCCFMAIDRESPRKAINTINQASELLKEQEVSVGVYPEGTRSKNGVLLPFHNGVLRIAQKANASIAVVVLKGTEKIHKNYPFHRTCVEMIIAEVIPAEQVCSTRSAELGDKIRNIIENNLK